MWWICAFLALPKDLAKNSIIKYLDWLFLLPDYKRNVQIPGKKENWKKNYQFYA